MPTEEPTSTTGICPDCGAATVARKSKKGKTYYSCTSFPQCKFMSWDMPTGTRCELCGEPMVKTAEGVGCSNKDCKNYLPPKRVSRAKAKVTKLEQGQTAPPPLMEEPIYFGGFDAGDYED